MGVKNYDKSCLMDAGVPEVYRLETKALYATNRVLLVVSSQITAVSLATPYIYCKLEISLVAVTTFDTCGYLQYRQRHFGPG